MVEKFELKIPKQESQSDEEKEINLDVESLPISCYKKEFYYPDKIQKETKIEGYERIKIPWENLTNVFRSLLNEPDLEIRSKEDIESLPEKIRSSHPKFTDDKEYETARSAYNAANPNYDFANFGYNEVNEIKNKIFLSFSIGEFPRKTINHTMGGYNRSEEHLEQFLKDRLFLQGILDPDFYKKSRFHLQEIETRAVLFNKDNFDIELTPQSEFMESDSVNYQKKDFDIGLLGRDKVLKKFEDRKLAAISILGGLNVESGKIWHGSHFDPIFGFDPNEYLFKNYLQEVAYCYRKLGKSQNLKISLDTIASLKFMLKDEINEFDYPQFLKNKLPQDYEKKLIRSGHPFIPILLNGKIIPHLCWGHAKYAVIPGKNLNLIKFKHLNPAEGKR